MHPFQPFPITAEEVGTCNKKRLKTIWSCIKDHSQGGRGLLAANNAALAPLGVVRKALVF